MAPEIDVQRGRVRERDGAMDMKLFKLPLVGRAVAEADPHFDAPREVARR